MGTHIRSDTQLFFWYFYWIATNHHGANDSKKILAFAV